MSSYDSNNVFAKILRGEIPSKPIYEDEFVLAFNDIFPQKKVHALIITKGAYQNITEFGENAQDNELLALFRAVPKVAKLLGLQESGYRIVTNNGEDGGQEIPHLHLHILGGEKVGPMVS